LPSCPFRVDFFRLALISTKLRGGITIAMNSLNDYIFG